MKIDTGPSELNRLDIPTMVLFFSFSAKITLTEVLCGKAHCHHAKSTRHDKDLALFINSLL
jgi:hypothetical protein